MKSREPRNCELCGERFANQWDYAGHKRRQHPGWRNSLADKPEPVAEPVQRRLAYCPCCGADLRALQAALEPTTEA